MKGASSFCGRSLELTRIFSPLNHPFNFNDQSFNYSHANTGPPNLQTRVKRYQRIWLSYSGLHPTPSPYPIINAPLIKQTCCVKQRLSFHNILSDHWPARDLELLWGIYWGPDDHLVRFKVSWEGLSLRSGLPEIVKNISFIFFASVEQATKEFVNKLWHRP